MTRVEQLNFFAATIRVAAPIGGLAIAFLLGGLHALLVIAGLVTVGCVVVYSALTVNELLHPSWLAWLPCPPLLRPQGTLRSPPLPPPSPPA